MPTEISQDAIDLIIEEEVSSEATYRRLYEHPTWPGVRSGPTVGIGYDLGQTNAAVIRKDWSPHLPADMVTAMVSVAGIHGTPGQAATARIRNKVQVPWETAEEVFLARDVPRWIAIVRAHLANTDELGPDCLGALVSLTFNRGPSFDEDGPRYREMRAIKACMAAGNFAAIPAELRLMKRIWPNKSERGLVLRREHEAQLFERGLKAVLTS